MRRRGHDIFEISDELWNQGEADPRPEEHQAKRFEHDRPRAGVRTGGERSNPRLEYADDAPARLGDGVRARAGGARLLVAAGALVAGAIAMAATRLPDRGPEPPPAMTKATKTPAVRKATRRMNRTSSESRVPASSGHNGSLQASKSTPYPPARATRVARRSTRVGVVRAPRTSRVTEPDRTAGLGHEFSFER